MAKCLRCGADASWLQGRVPDEVPVGCGDGMGTRVVSVQSLQAELAALRERVATAEAGFVKACAVVARSEARVAELESALRGMLTEKMTHYREDWPEVVAARAALSAGTSRE